MYQQHFNLREMPFSIAPDPAFLYMSARHQEALGHLLFGTGQYGGFVQLTGEVGTGKTTVVRSLLEQKLPQVKLVLIHNPRQSELEFLQSLCDGLDLDYSSDDTSLKRLNDRINGFLLRQHAMGQRTVLIIDEAQQLSPEVMEQVRLLTNLETNKEKLLRIMLIGQPELIDLLNRRDLRQLAQRITARHHLTPLSADETREYVQHRLQVSGGARELFSEAALRAVHRHSKGIPRLINIVCDRALLGAYARSLRQVEQPLVESAAFEALGDHRRPAPSGLAPRASVPTAVAAGAVIAAMLVGLLLARERGGVSPSSAAVPVTTESPITAVAVAAAGRPLAPITPSAPLPELRTQDLYPSAESGLPALAALWSLPAASQGLDCSALREQRLECLPRTGAGLDELRQLGLPAVVGLHEDGKGERGYVLLRHLDATRALLDTAAGPRQLTATGLQQRWTGDYLLLWRRGSDELRIGPANRGASVLWLRSRLSAALGREIGRAGDESWDRALQQALLEFQRRQGLKADGIAGPRTLVALSDRRQAPSLSMPNPG